MADTPQAADDVALAAPEDPLAQVEAWRARGAADTDPVRWHHIEALARRARTMQGLARTLLAQRLQQLLQAHAAADMRAATTACPPLPTAPGPLAELVAALAASSPPLQDESADTPRAAPPPGPAAAPTLKSLHYFRDTWSRLGLPDNAGPLNSQLLVHRALRQMRETSPAYLQHFMGYVEALMWMDQAQGAATSGGAGRAGKESPPTKARPRPSGRKR